MFTAQHIQDAHSKVKTGADFPRYIQDLKKLGIDHYSYQVANGSSVYYDKDGQSLTIALAHAISRTVADSSSTEQLLHAIRIHQAGQTDFITFCQQAAAAGVEKWTNDLRKMLCSYYDKKGKELYAEPIPEAGY